MPIKRRYSADYILSRRERERAPLYGQVGGPPIFATPQEKLNNHIPNQKKNYILAKFLDKPESYIKFLICLCEKYQGIVKSTSTGIELICQEILIHVDPNKDLKGYDIHKSLFYDYVLKDRIIKVQLIVTSNRNA